MTHTVEDVIPPHIPEHARRYEEIIYADMEQDRIEREEILTQQQTSNIAIRNIVEVYPTSTGRVLGLILGGVI